MDSNDSFDRPAAYWLGRARQAEANGDPVRAAVLERHALRSDPDNADASVGYALTLRRLECYESSNRVAFAALARGCPRTSLYGLIGQNLLALDFRKAAFDAIDLYLCSPLPGEPGENHPPTSPARLYRFNGTWESSHRLTVRHEQRFSIRRALERALSEAAFCARQGDEARALSCLSRLLSLYPGNATALAGAARILQSMGRHARACSLLCGAALYARMPGERQLICQTSELLDEPGIALAMLTRMQRQMPTRLPVCHDLAVALCRVGRAQEALRYAHLCREIDPDDLQAQWLMDCVVGLTSGRPCHPAYWGAWDRERTNGLLAPVLQSLSDGTLADALQTDSGMRQRFLYLMETPVPQSLPALQSVAEGALPRDALCRLLREVLLRRPEDTPVKRFALQKLMDLDEKPPYAIWAGERFRMAAPEKAQEVRYHENH